jgi:hypothetical protein
VTVRLTVWCCFLYDGPSSRAVGGVALSARSRDKESGKWGALECCAARCVRGCRQALLINKCYGKDGFCHMWARIFPGQSVVGLGTEAGWHYRGVVHEVPTLPQSSGAAGIPGR